MVDSMVHTKKGHTQEAKGIYSWESVTVARLCHVKSFLVHCYTVHISH